MPARRTDTVVTTKRAFANSTEMAKTLERDIECDLAWICERASVDDRCLIYGVVEEITRAGVYACTADETKSLFAKLQANVHKTLHG